MGETERPPPRRENALTILAKRDSTMYLDIHILYTLRVFPGSCSECGREKEREGENVCVTVRERAKKSKVERLRERERERNIYIYIIYGGRASVRRSERS